LLYLDLIALFLLNKFRLEAIEKTCGLDMILPCSIPVRDLNTDEDANDHNDEIEPNREPVLGSHVLSDAAEDHGANTSLTISTELANKSAVKQKAVYIFITSDLP
jgi:hypothetical protein